MMHREDKERLNNEVKRKYWLLRLVTGIKSVFRHWQKALVIGVYVFILFLLLYFRDDLFSTENQDMFEILNNILYQLLIPVFGFGGLFFLFIAFGTPFGSKGIRDNLNRIGLANHAGETPLLVNKYKDADNKRLTIMEFEVNGIPLKEWEDKKAKIEAALNVYVAKISEGKNKRRILLYTLPVNGGLPSIVHWKDNYINKEDFVLVLGEGLLGKVTIDLSIIPHILLGGSTGSGKSILLKLLIMHCIQKNAVVCIADFKGGVDFPSVWRRQCRIVIEEKELLALLCVLTDELMNRKKLFQETECANIREYNQKTDAGLQRYIFVCDEVAEILDKTGLDKNKKETVLAIENKLSTIARLGRAFGIHLILATQRPDANILTGQIRNNLDYRVCGRADNVLSQIILDNTSASDQIPKDAQADLLPMTEQRFKVIGLMKKPSFITIRHSFVKGICSTSIQLLMTKN